MKAEDTKSTFQRLREGENGDGWKIVVEDGKEKERNEKSLLISDYFMHSSIDRERWLLDEKRVKWIARKMEMITKEMRERFLGIKGVEYRVDKQAAEKMPATISPEEIERRVFEQHWVMELLLLYEVNEWEQLFWNKLKALLDQIGNDRVEVKERLTREWRADCWKRLNPQMLAAQKRLTDYKHYSEDMLDLVSRFWASSISGFFEGIGNRNSMSLREEIKYRVGLLERIYPLYHIEICPKIESEMEDIEFRLKCGFELGRFDQFWDDNTLFRCRYSRSKWLSFERSISASAPLKIYSHALKGNKNIIHITFKFYPTSDVTRFSICDLPWVTSISLESSDSFGVPAVHDGPLFFTSADNDLTTFTYQIRHELDRSSTYIFTDADGSSITDSGELGNYARVLISFVAPTTGQSLTLRLKHSGNDANEDPPLEVTLGSTIIQLSPSSKSPLTIDDITLYPRESNPTPGPSEPDHLSFWPGQRNNIFIRFGGPWRNGQGDTIFKEHGHLLHDIDLLDEAGLKDPKNQIINAD